MDLLQIRVINSDQANLFLDPYKYGSATLAIGLLKEDHEKSCLSRREDETSSDPQAAGPAVPDQGDPGEQGQDH